MNNSSNGARAEHEIVLSSLVKTDLVTLLQVVRTNRLALLEGGTSAEQEFALPNPGGGLVQVSVELPRRLSVDDFA